MKWNASKEAIALSLRSEGKTYREIAAAMNTTTTSVKHKIRRLSQASNLDKYKHTSEKTEQLLAVLNCISSDAIHILETHSGFGGMTEQYQKIGDVECYDIDSRRVDHINTLCMEGVTAIKGDSECEIHRLIFHKCVYDIVDIDPYGLPSRYFSHAFSLIKDGIMFLTFPMMGVAQINKITIRHYQAFWGIELSDKDIYIQKIIAKLEDFAFQCKREIDFLDIRKIDRVFRIAIRVKKKSLCDIVGLKVNRNTVFLSQNDEVSHGGSLCNH